MSVLSTVSKRLRQREPLVVQCARCGLVRDEQGRWANLNGSTPGPEQVTTSICPACISAYAPLWD